MTRVFFLPLLSRNFLRIVTITQSVQSLLLKGNCIDVADTPTVKGQHPCLLHISVCFTEAGVACNYVLYAILSGGHYCICNNVRRTVLHMQSCPPGRCCIMQLCPPGHICICSCVRPVQNRPCSKLNALGRRNTFAIFYKLSACHE